MTRPATCSRPRMNCARSAASTTSITTTEFRPGWSARTGRLRMSKFPKALLAAAFLCTSLAPALAGKLGVGREAPKEEIAGWDIDLRPDGQGLPKGKGTAAQGEPIFQERCAMCHGEFGEGKDK